MTVHEQVGKRGLRQAPRAWVIALSLAFIAAHGAGLAFAGEWSWLVSLAFLSLAPLLAGAAAYHRARHGGYRDGWLALAAAMLLWAAGMAGNVASGVWLDSWSGVGALSMLLFTLYGVPLIFIVASPEVERWPVRLVDAALALVLGYLFFRHTFAFATMEDADEAGLVGLRLMFDVENLFIALIALIRFVATAEPARRHFFRQLVIFAFAYLATAAFINHLTSDSYYGIAADVVISIPFLLLAGLALTAEPAGEMPRPQTFARIVRVGGPLMLPAALLIVAATLVRAYPALAIAGCAIAILGYGLRTILVQMDELTDRDELERLTRVDALTGLANRRQFDAAFDHEWSRARRMGEGLALLMIDIDHFKMLNDNMGHPVGDQRLRAVAAALAVGAPPAALVARYGGDEFAVILPGVGNAQAAALAERYCKQIRDLCLPSPAPVGHITVSIGVAHARADGGAEQAALLVAADGALYDAKQTGRNRFVAQMLS